MALILSPWIRAWSPYAAGVIFILASASIIAPNTEVSVAFRVIGIGFLCFSGVGPASKLAGLLVDRQRRGPEMLSWLPLVAGSLFAFLLFAAAFHGQWVEFILYGFGLILLALAVTVTSITVPREVAKVGVIFALVFVVVGSLVYGLTTPDLAVEGARLRGLTPNANMLGFYAFLLGSIALIVVRLGWTRIVLLSFSGVVLLWTSSRASILALAIVFLFLVLSRLSATRVLALLGTAGAVAIAATVSPHVLGVLDGLFRRTDSRALTLTGAFDAFRSSPLIGIGLHNEEFEIASSPLRALAYAGIGGLLAVLVIWTALIWNSRTAGLPAVGFTLAAVVHSLFEGWLLSPVSPMLLTFVLVWGVVVRHGSGQIPSQRSCNGPVTAINSIMPLEEPLSERYRRLKITPRSPYRATGHYME